MLRTLVNRIMGRKRVLDESLSLREVINLLNSLDSTVEIDLSYYERLSGRRIEWINESPIRISTFLEFRFATELCSKKRQVFTGKLAEKHYIDLRGSHKKVSLSYLI